jgi:hypothetical protein
VLRSVPDHRGAAHPRRGHRRRHNALVFGGFYAILNLAFPFSPSFPMMGACAPQLHHGLYRDPAASRTA